ncbi:MAG: hypothetical protein IKC88_04670, partial [Opitutales bacterium]|nr:hypothetical protein [Opitutales bacterium]
MKKLFVSSFILSMLSASALIGADNYFTGITWGASAAIDNWSLKARASDDDLIFDGTYYTDYATATKWDIGYWVNTGLAANYKEANSITIRNLHNANNEKMDVFLTSSGAASNLIHVSTGALTFVTDEYNSSFTWRNTEGKTLNITLGGINMGSAESKSTDGGTLCFGGNTNVSSLRSATALRGLSISGAINLYGNSTLKLNVGVEGESTTSNKIFDVGTPTTK